MGELGLDLDDPHLTGTPDRITKMFCLEFFASVGKEFTDFTIFANDKGYNQIVMLDNIHFTSICAHHFLPFSGQAWILYIPDQALCGVSKMARLVEFYSKRPQIQENLCQVIMAQLVGLLFPKGAMVVMRAVHDCMACRGVNQHDAKMISSAVYGCFAEDEKTRLEGLHLIELSLKG